MASDSSPKEDNLRRSPIKRLQISLNVLMQITLVVVIVSAANYLSCQKYRQWDHSATKLYSISQQSRNILGALTKDVKITVAYDRDSDLYDYVTHMMALYEKEAKGRISVRIFDPKRDPSVAADMRAKDSNLHFDENMIIVEVEGEMKRFVREQQIVQREDNTPLRSDLNYQGRIVAYRLESPLTSSIMAVTQNRRQVVYMIADKGPLRRVDDGTHRGDAWGVLSTQGQTQNLEMRALQLQSVNVIPQDASAVICVNPSVDFTQRELDMLFKEYWDRRKGGIMILFNPDYRGDIINLVHYLTTHYGVRLEPNRVMKTQSPGGITQKQLDVAVNFMSDAGDTSPIIEDLDFRGSSFRGGSSRIGLLKDDPNILAADGLRYSVLAMAGAGYWAEYNYTQDNIIMDPREAENLYLAVSLERGAGRDARLRSTVDSARMVVVGNAGLLDPDRLTNENVEFVLNSLNWVSDRDELIGGIESRRAGQYRITIEEDKYSQLEWLAIKIFPASVFLLGCLVMFFRRH